MNIPKMSYRVFLWFCFFPTVMYGYQDQITFRGKVLDEKTNAPLALASVIIQRTSIGVTTGELGDFTFHIPAEHKKDTIIVSFIGYQSTKLPVASIVSATIHTLKLQPNVYDIGEIKVVEKKKKRNVKEIVQNAIAKIPDNYPLETFQLSGYYRDYLTEDDRYYNLVEAALTVEDKGFSNNDHLTTAVKLEQIRINKEYPLRYGSC